MGNLVQRANDPKANDKRHQILSTLGMMLDTELSMRTKQNLVDRLTELCKGEQLNENWIRSLGIEGKIQIDASNERSVVLRIPKEYVPSTIQDDRDNQVLTLKVNKRTNVEDLHGDSAQMFDKEGNVVTPDAQGGSI